MECSVFLGREGKNAPDVTLTSFSPNGLYLASADADGGINVWDVTTRTLVAKFEPSDAIQSLAWSPVGNVLGFLTCDGELGFCNDVIPANLPQPSNRIKVDKGNASIASAADEKSNSESKTKLTEVEKVSKAAEKATKPTSVAGDTMKKEKKKSSGTRKKKSARIIVEEEDDDDDDDDEEDTAADAIKNSLIAAEASSDEDEEFDSGDLTKITEKYMNPKPPQIESNQYEAEGEQANEPQVLYAPETSLQLSFQSGETPKEEKHRFMVWNLHGSIISRTEDAYSTIEIQFSNASKRGQKFPDYTGLQIADLNEHGAVFASLLSDEQLLDERTKDGSIIKFLPFNSWAHTSDLSFNLPARESAVSVAINDTCFAVATTTNYLRVFNHSGTQLFPLLLPGKTVTMAAHGSLLAVVYHDASPFTPSQGSSQTLGFALYNTNCGLSTCCNGMLVKEIASGRLPLTPANPNDEDPVELFWLGFSDEGMLMAYDTNGVLLSLSPADYKHWIPVLDTRQYNKSSTEFHWPVGISPNRFHFVKCAGPTREKRFPRTRPRPLLGAHDFGVSTVQMSGTNEKIERNLMNKALAYSSNIALAQQGIIDMSDDKTYAQFQLDMDKNIVKLIQVASKEDLFERVIDLAHRLQTPKCFDLAIKICRNRRQDALVEKIFNIQQMRVNEKYDQQQKMLRSTVAEEQEQAQPISEAVQAHNDTKISATNLNDDEVKPFTRQLRKAQQVLAVARAHR